MSMMGGNPGMIVSIWASVKSALTSITVITKTGKRGAGNIITQFGWSIIMAINTQHPRPEQAYKLLKQLMRLANEGDW
jgi:hypothetical protein